MPTPTITITRHKEGSRSAGIDASWNRTYFPTYRAVTSSPRVGPQKVLAKFLADFYPIGAYYRYGNPTTEPDTYEFDGGSYLQNVRVDPEGTGDALNYVISCEYGPTQPLEENPIDRTAKVKWDFASTEEIVDEDQDGDPIVNTAFDSFDPPITRDKKNAIVTVSRNEAQFPYDLVRLLTGGVNEFDFLETGDAGCWKVNKIAAAGESVTVQLRDGTDVTYWPVVYELERKDGGWLREVLNQGMRQLNGDGSAHKAIFINGQPISAPMLLDADGHLLAPDGTPVYLSFRIHPTIDFADLNFSGIDFGQGPLP